MAFPLACFRLLSPLIQPSYLSVENFCITPRLVALAHYYGIRVLTWTMNKPKASYTLFQEAKVDGIISDYPFTTEAYFKEQEEKKEEEKREEESFIGDLSYFSFGEAFHELEFETRRLLFGSVRNCMDLRFMEASMADASLVDATVGELRSLYRSYHRIPLN